MRFAAATRTKIDVAMVTTYDPTGSSIELGIDGAWYPCVWLDSPVQTGNRWSQAARTVGYFTGPTGTLDDATVLPLRRRATQTRVTLGGQVIVAASDPIDVR